MKTLIYRFFLLFFLGGIALHTYCQNEVQNPTSGFWKTNGNAGTNSGANFIGTTTNNSLSIRTNSVQRMVVDSTGNVGIGVSNPSQKLDVAGNLRITQAFMPGGNAGTSGQLLVSGGNNTAPTWSPFTIGNSSATTIIAKYYASLSWSGNWANNTTRVFTVIDPDCRTSSVIAVSFTGTSTTLDNIVINNVQTANGSFKVSLTNNTGGGLVGSIAIGFIAFY